jgi:methylphosphotriester-DNA--protein-cysteine methyltransferase
VSISRTATAPEVTDAGADSEHSSRSVGSPAWPARVRAADDRTASRAVDPSTVRRRVRVASVQAATAHEASSARDSLPSPEVSIAGLRCAAGISAMSSTWSTVTDSGDTTTPL